MNVRQAERKLRDLMRRKPSISQPGRLLAHLLNEINVENDQQRMHSRTLERALDRLEAVGVIHLERTGSVLNGYVVTAKGKRELASKKKVSRKQPSQAHQASKQVDPAATQTDKLEQGDNEVPNLDMPRHELVTLALQALQVQADSQGHLYVRSTAAVIAEALGISEDQARELNRPLGALGLRKSPRGQNPGNRRPHWVTLKVTEVTETMLSMDSSDVVAAPSDHEAKLLEVIADLERQLEEAIKDARSSADLREQLFMLQETHERDQAAMAEGARVLGLMTAEKESLTQELELAKAQLREANAQLLAAVAPSAAVQEVLERYGKK